MGQEKVAVVGAGQMGRGIAQVFIQAGFPVKLLDQNEEITQNAANFIQTLLEKGVKKGKWEQEHVTQSMKLLQTTCQMQELGDSTLVIEAASENKNIKFSLFQQLEKHCSSDCILASNTSSISITEIAAQTSSPQRVVGMHFMNPVPVMKLVEVIQGLETSEKCLQKITQLSEAVGKTTVIAKDYPGFAVNRILMPMINEACYALYEGLSSIEDIDKAMKLGTNVPMGPLELADFIGLDTCLAIMEILFEGFADSKYRPCPLLRQYVLAGKLGRKVKRGFYDY